jgi:Ca2+-binding EF-hand superfamily protein
MLFFIYFFADFDEDNFIDREDIVAVIRATIGEQKLSDSKLRRIADRVMDEADLDGSQKLSRPEFMRTVYRLPDFAS